MWKRKGGFMATYGKLLDACVQKNCHKCPERIVKLLGASG
jgi:hypothetical protein